MDNHYEELWNMILNEIPNHLKLIDDSVMFWFGRGAVEIKFISEDNCIYLAVNNYIKCNFINSHYKEALADAIEAVLAVRMTPVLICTEQVGFEDQFEAYVAREAKKLKEEASENVFEKNDEDAQDEEEIVDGFPKDEKESFDEEYKKELAEQKRNLYMSRMHDVFPPEPDVPVAKHRNLGAAIHKGVNAPKRYNKGSGLMEEVPISEKYLDDDNSGMLYVSGSVPISYPSYTFENFVVGASNRFAYQYALQASRYPAQQYNPLYIYGAPGLGKTHLLYSIINETMRLNPSFSVIYVKGEDFTNELVEAIQKRTPLQFREKYRNADVLLVDDVQFIAGKESTQEEFFHTYNALYETNKQIIITSDKAPKDIVELEERLRSRFEGGPIVKIDPPDLELRTAIIKKKFELMDIKVPNDVLMFLSENIKDNVRQIEGVVKKLNTYCMMTHQEISLELARSQISDIISISSVIDKRRILGAVSEKYGVTPDDILGKHKTKEIAWARHMAIFLMKRLTEMTYSDIGRFFKRDHSTIMTAVNKMEKESAENASAAREVEELIEIIKTTKNG